MIRCCPSWGDSEDERGQTPAAGPPRSSDYRHSSLHRTYASSSLFCTSPTGRQAVGLLERAKAKWSSFWNIARHVRQMCSCIIQWRKITPLLMLTKLAAAIQLSCLEASYAELRAFCPATTSPSTVKRPRRPAHCVCFASLDSLHFAQNTFFRFLFGSFSSFKWLQSNCLSRLLYFCSHPCGPPQMNSSSKQVRQ